MAKFKISPAPTFSATVQIPRVGSEPLAVQFTFKYLDRLGLAAFLDRLRADGEKLFEGSGSRTTLEQAEAEIEAQVGQLGEIIVAWEFDDEVSETSIRALASTFSGSPDAVLKAYYEAYRQARMGNSLA